MSLNASPCPLGVGKILHETNLAFLFQPEDDDPFWVPKSVVHDDSEVWTTVGDHDEGELVVAMWWAEKNGRG